MKSDFEKIDINKLVNVPTSLNNLETKLQIRCWQVENCSRTHEKLNNVLSKEVAKNAAFNALKGKINNLEKKISEATTTQINNFCIKN